MKKYIAALLLFFCVGLILPKKSYAFGDFIKPTSFLYALQSWKESAELFFSFSKAKKLDYLQKLNIKRIRELEDYGTSNARTAEMLANKYENNYKMMETLVPQVQNKQQVAEKIESDSLAQQEELAQVYQKVPSGARQVIMDAEVNSSKSVSAILGKASPERAAEYAQKTQEIQKVQMMEKNSSSQKNEQKTQQKQQTQQEQQAQQGTQQEQQEQQGQQTQQQQMQSGEPAQMQSSGSQN